MPEVTRESLLTEAFEGAELAHKVGHRKALADACKLIEQLGGKAPKLTIGRDRARTALYRHYTKNGMLLYVGISLSAVGRQSRHKQEADWFDAVARIEIEWHPTRRKALAAEKRAIETERPICNIQHAPWFRGLVRHA